jgi:hypothetical protein
MLNIFLSASVYDSSLLNDVKFYIILAILAVALITICVLFATKDRFKVKNNLVEEKDIEYIPPQIIKVRGKKDIEATSKENLANNEN